MTKKWKIFGLQTKVEWYDVKTKFKKLLRKIIYSFAFQELICFVVIAYMKLVYHSSRKIFINHEKLFETTKTKAPLIFVFWHNRLMMIPCEIYSNYPKFETEVLVASIRNPTHITQAASIGADVATIPAKILKQLISHPLTDKGLEIFAKDWAATGQKII